ncbi:MAG: MFS transporter [Syntrophobacteraceae bacterium]|jgi:sugar phosphate permease
MAETNSQGKSPWYHDYRWMILAIMFAGSVVNYLDRVNLSIANTTIAKEFGLGPVEMGLLMSAFMWSYAFANLPAGWLLDKFGIKSIFLWSTVAWSVSTIAGGFAQGFVSMYVIRLILGIAEAPFFICSGQFTKTYFAENERGTASSVINMGPKIANGFAPPLLTFMLIGLGWRSMFISLGVVGFLLAVVWLKYYREDPGLLPKADKDIVREKSSSKADYLAILKHPTTLWFCLGNIGSSYVFWLYFTWLPTYLTTERGMTLTQAGWAAMVPFIGGVAAVPIGGYMSDYLIRKGMNLIRARLVPTVGGCLLAAVAVAPLNYVHETSLAVILMTVSLFAGALRVGVLWALVGDIAPPGAVGRFGGIQNFANFVGAALAPIGTGYILKATGSYDHVFTVSAILCALGALSYMMINRKITAEDLRIGPNTEQA